MAKDNSVHAVVGLSGFGVDSGHGNAIREHFVRFELPQSFSIDDVAVMQKDFEILSEIAAQYPEDLTELHNAVLTHDFGRANQLAEKIGMTEEQISARGGGQIGIAIGIIVVLVIVAGVAGHNGGSSSPRPVGPGDPADGGTDGGTDAGTG